MEKELRAITQHTPALPQKVNQPDRCHRSHHRWLMVAFTTLIPIGGYLWPGISAQAQVPSNLPQATQEAESSSIQLPGTSAVPEGTSSPVQPPGSSAVPEGTSSPVQPPGSSPTAQESETPSRYEETPYTLGSGDVVNINIFNVPEYSGDYRVTVDGAISLPIVGTINVEGLTIPQANNLVTQRYATILQRPIVSLALVQPRPIQVAIAGEVNQPGSYILRTAGDNDVQGFPPITLALEEAGGITRSANVRQVKLHRFFGGEEYVLNVNLWKLVQDGEIVQDVTLRDGDRIIVPTLAENDPQETRALSQSSIAPGDQVVEVAVVGEVNRPGTYDVSSTVTSDILGNPPTITQALEAAGGITNLSDIRNVEVERVTRQGTKRLSANLWALLKEGDISQDLLLQPGDTVVIPRAQDITSTEVEDLASSSFSPDTIRVTVIGEPEAPGTLELPPNTPLNQAILEAGGFNPRARRGEVELVRLNPNGTVTRRDIDIDLDQGVGSLDAETNPALRDDDVIVVKRSVFASAADSIDVILRPFTQAFGALRLFEFIFD
jgi:polysaccharide export outer membrane protein